MAESGSAIMQLGRPEDGFHFPTGRLASLNRLVDYRPPDTLSDCARRGFALRVQCGACGHTVDVEALDMMMRTFRVPRSQLLASLRAKLRCSACGARQAHLKPVMGVR